MRYLLILLILVSSCRLHNRDEEDIPKADITELQIVDSEFSDYSKQHGMRRAFLEYIDDDGVMMKDQSLPIKGARAIDLISSMNDSTVTMTWEPEGGDIAASGELGYTYGIYEMRDRENNVQRGTYVTIWKKQKDGKWKFVLDSGNQGLGDELQ
jgi:ketosteroid isomerase-like protein